MEDRKRTLISATDLPAFLEAALRRYRETHPEISERHFARRVAIDPATLCKAKKGVARLHARTLGPLSDEFDLSVEEVVHFYNVAGFRLPRSVDRALRKGKQFGGNDQIGAG